MADGNASYAAVGSKVMKGQVALKPADSEEPIPYDIVVLRLSLNPLDTASDDVITIDVAYAREDVDRLIESLIVGSDSVPYLSAQVTIEEAN